MTDESHPPMGIWKIIGLVLGFVILLGITSNCIISIQENAVIYNKTITVSGRICETALTPYSGVVVDDEGHSYFFNGKDCNKYNPGETIDISYTHVHQIFSISDDYDFNRIVGSPVICEETPVYIDKCNQSSDIVILVSVYRNVTDKDPLWTQLKVSTDCGEVRQGGYSQNHTLLVSQTEKLKVTVTRVFDPDTGNTTLVKANPVYFYPIENDYRIVIGDL